MSKFLSKRECKRLMREAYFEYEQLMPNLDEQQRHWDCVRIVQFLTDCSNSIKGANETRVNELIRKL
jgi:cytochrome c2